MKKFFDLVENNSEYILVALAVLVIILIAALIYLIITFSKMNKKYEAFMAGSDGANLESTILNRFKEIDILKKANSTNEKDIATINEELLSTYKKVGIVKYDAFNEMGGKLSFALAMLDKCNNGYIINAMHSREGCYTYIKEIVKGESYITLGEEEKTALEQAIKSDNVTVE